MNADLTILTEKQRQVFLLREEGCKFKDIAEKVGISSATASKYYNQAVKTIELAEWYQKKTAEFSEATDITLTKGDVAVIQDALLIFEKVYYEGRTRRPANRYQAEYIETKERAFRELKRRVMIYAMGEEKYGRLTDAFK